MTFKVAILIPSTTKEREWKNIKETYLYKINLKSFLLTYCPEHTYKYYEGIDEDDRIYFTTKETAPTYTKEATLAYMVRNRFLVEAMAMNRAVFDILGLNTKETKQLAEKCYEYKPIDGGVWPYFKNGDYKAAERLIREIYRLLGDDSAEIHKPILTRFEILDL